MLDHFGGVWKSETEYGWREDCRRFEFWEKNIGNQLGLGAAVQYAMRIGMPNIQARVQLVAQQLRALLGTLAPAVVVADVGEEKSGIVTFYLKDKNGNVWFFAPSLRT